MKRKLVILILYCRRSLIKLLLTRTNGVNLKARVNLKERYVSFIKLNKRDECSFLN
jgi:hypothetical protein